MTTSRDACTATTSKLATQPHSRSLLLGNAATELDRRHAAARGDAGDTPTNPAAADLRPFDRTGREGHIQRDSRGARRAVASRGCLSPTPDRDAVRTRSTVLGGRSELRSRVPRPPHRAAAAGRLAAAVHPGRAAARPADRPAAPTVGDHRHRGAEFRSGSAEGLLRDGAETAPLRGRRHGQRADDRGDARPRPGQPTPPGARPTVAPRPVALDRRLVVAHGNQGRAVSVASRHCPRVERPQGGARTRSGCPAS